LEYPFPTLDSFLTPNDRFFVRSHFAPPDLKASNWRLSVEGHVERPFEIGFDELRKLASRTVTSLIECSGNSRAYLDPPQVGVRWEQGAVGNAEWTGVPLSALLDRAGEKPGALEVILEGHDKGAIGDPLPKTPGEISYSRSLPLEKARRPETLLAWGMNGEDLSPAHGHPVRAVVPGWYGMASVKWLRRVVVTDRPFHGYFQTLSYTVWERQHGGLPSLVPVAEVDVKAQIARPMSRETVKAGAACSVFGAAWAGEPEVRKVEVSTDGGKTWAEAKLDDKSVPFAWRFFGHEWSNPTPGRHVLMARATDARGRVQPVERDRDRRDAVISHVQPIEVMVR
jgi:DMSO/TMAO reductase YedYZ molybdopterin-dependent catalytic subunit